jgi:hypothetical protein
MSLEKERGNMGEELVFKKATGIFSFFSVWGGE